MTGIDFLCVRVVWHLPLSSPFERTENPPKREIIVIFISSLTGPGQRLSKEVYDTMDIKGIPYGEISTNQRNQYREKLKEKLMSDGYPINEDFIANASNRLSSLGVWSRFTTWHGTDPQRSKDFPEGPDGQKEKKDVRPGSRPQRKPRGLVEIWG
jgi:hypothetical protein